MTESLPGSSSGKSLGVGAAKAALRLMGGADLADAIADMTGIERKKIPRIVSRERTRLDAQEGHEYRWVGLPDEREAIEQELVRCFSRAARLPITAGNSIPLSALMGTEELINLVERFLLDPDWAQWSEQAPPYFDGLAEAVAQFVVSWYTENAQGQSVATQAGVIRLIHGQMVLADHLTSLRAEVERVAMGNHSSADITNLGNILPPPAATPPSLPTGRQVALIHTTPPDASTTHRRSIRRLSQWARWLLIEQGFEVIPGTRLTQLPPVTVSVSTADSKVTISEDAADERTDAKPPTGPLTAHGVEVALLVSADGNLSIDGRVIAGDEAAVALVVGVASAMGIQLDDGPASLRYDPSSELPRLKRLSAQALHEAGQVGSSAFGEGDGARLYVRRDLEDVVLSELDTRDLVVVSGDAGAGKTSLLWGLARRLADRDEAQDTYFIKASYLSGSDGDQGVLITANTLLQGIRERAAHAEATVLIDTADLLVNDEALFDNFMKLLEEIRGIGARVVVTSRPSEAALITSGTDAPLTLGAYSLTSRRGHHQSEFVRAVRSHALTYCRTPGDTGELAEQLLTAVIRQQELGETARLPLTLRMLFELYAPSPVPLTISATDLYQRYWADRVETDRRTWTPNTPQKGRDLGGTCLTLAAAMLRTGVPEIRIASAQLLSYPAPVLQSDVDELCGRGVGSITQQGTFRFFHQTFFEYAAALLLLELDGGLTTAVERSESRPDDYFFGPVVEQAWILAWLRGDRMAEAARMTRQVLKAEAHPNTVNRCVIVLAQVPVPDEVSAHLRNTIESGGFSSAKEYFKQIPRPGLPWQTVDTDLLTLLHARVGNAARDLVVGVLRRQALSEPNVAMDVVEAVAYGSTRAFLDDEALERIEVRALLSTLLRGAPTRTLQFLDVCGAGTTFAAQPTHMARLFRALAYDAGADSAAVATWATQKADRLKGRPDTSVVVALGHLQALAMRAEPHSPIGEEVLAHLSLILERITEVEAITTNQMAWIWALFDSLTRRQADGTLIKVIDRMLSVSTPALHEQLHHGLLVGPINQSELARRHLAEVVARGLPANRRSPIGLEQRWADTVRRTLCRPDTDPLPLVGLATHVAELVSPRVQEDLWLDRDLMLWPLLAAAHSGHPKALKTLQALTNGSLQLADADERIVVQQAQSLDNLRPGTAQVLAYLVSRSAFVELLQLTNRIPELPWPGGTAEAVSSQLWGASLTGSWKERCRAMRLLVAAVRVTLIPAPEWSKVAELAASPDATFRSELSVLVADEAIRGTYAAHTAADLLKTLVDAAPANQSSPIRFNYIRLLANTGDAASIPLAITTALQHPVEGGTVTALAGYLVPSARRGHIEVQHKLALITTVGRSLGLPGVPKSARKDVPSAWHDVMSRVLHSATTPALLDVVAVTPEMGERFAASLLQRLPARPNADLIAAISRVRDSKAVSDLVRSAAASSLARLSPATASTGWAGLIEDLHAEQPQQQGGGNLPSSTDGVD